MGLDGVELIIEVEESFGFSIPDEDAAALDTAGKLYEYIIEHRFPDRREGCLSSAAFYRLRRTLMAVLGIPRSGVRLPVPLATSIPAQRRRIWAELQKSLRLRLPRLVRPRWAKRSAVALGVGLVAAAAVVLIAKLGLNAAIMPIYGTVALVGFVLYQATEPLAVEFAAEFATVAGLTKAVLQKNHAVISDACDRVSAAEVWETLRAMIVEHLDVPLDKVTKEANFVKDLGLT